MKITSILIPLRNKNLALSAYDTVTELSRVLYHRRITVDRFGYLNQFSCYNLLGTESFPEMAPTSEYEYFSDICDDVATSLIEKSNLEDKLIYVLWSGGVDSTCIISCLLRSGIPTYRLRVLYTDHSIIENERFFHFLHSRGITTIKLEDTSILLEAINNGYLVSGCCADSLFEEVTYYKLAHIYNNSYKELLKNLDLYKEIPKIMGMSTHYDLNINTVSDFFYMMNFCCNWGVDSLVIPTLVKTDNNVIRFFTDIRFQRWSLSRYKDKRISIRSDEDYKPEMKRIISEVTRDNSYKMLSKGFSRKILVYNMMIPFSYRDENCMIHQIPIPRGKNDHPRSIKEDFFRKLLKQDTLHKIEPCVKSLW